MALWWLDETDSNFTDYLLDIPDQHCHGPPDHGSQDNTARNKLLWAAAVCFLFTIGEAAGLHQGEGEGLGTETGYGNYASE